ncbi:Hsp20/alpha crystallin family protein [Desulfallas thermosapovorans]|uniref:HSP20 family protein n=1 Tax=Desulfallas thermosapovorans DSM 6562 TaxID=1121431 RepID=A0A5S4ZYR1_9FIRM|nr:Hsp20/alpha crystallin family protein [Desulfallas thermosapovorans]TYO98048.1 HSP20 family protein [Desulfallas thermosapovorans DSM 6562]
MALVPYDPFRSMDMMRREMERVFAPFYGDTRRDWDIGPRVDVYETDNEVVALCEIPGVEKKDDIHIDVRDNVLSISGIINRTNEVKDENRYHRTERFYGRFQRNVSLPARVNTEGAKATYRNGVLEVRMAKETHGRHKSIDVDFH